MKTTFVVFALVAAAIYLFVVPAISAPSKLTHERCAAATIQIGISCE